MIFNGAVFVLIVLVLITARCYEGQTLGDSGGIPIDASAAKDGVFVDLVDCHLSVRGGGYQCSKDVTTVLLLDVSADSACECQVLCEGVSQCNYLLGNSCCEYIVTDKKCHFYENSRKYDSSELQDVNAGNWDFLEQNYKCTTTDMIYELDWQNDYTPETCLKFCRYHANSIGSTRGCCQRNPEQDCLYLYGAWTKEPDLQTSSYASVVAKELPSGCPTCCDTMTPKICTIQDTSQSIHALATSLANTGALEATSQNIQDLTIALNNTCALEATVQAILADTTSLTSDPAHEETSQIILGQTTALTQTVALEATVQSILSDTISLKFAAADTNTDLVIVDNELQNLRGSVDVIDGDVEDLQDKVDILDDKVDILDAKIDTVQTTVDAMFALINALDVPMNWCKAVNGKSDADNSVCCMESCKACEETDVECSGNQASNCCPSEIVNSRNSCDSNDAPCSRG